MIEKPPHLKLADALRRAGLTDMAFSAAHYRYHPIHSMLVDPGGQLYRELVEAAATARATNNTVQHRAIVEIAGAHMRGEWEASEQESAAWAASPIGQATFRRLAQGE